MGLFDFFKSRRKGETLYPEGMSSADIAIGQAQPEGSDTAGWSGGSDPATVTALGTPGSPVVLGMEGLGGIKGLREMWKMGKEMSEAMQKGTLVSPDGTSGVIDARGSTEMREEIMQVLREHGMDPKAGQPMQVVDPKAMAAVAQVVSKHMPQIQAMQAESLKAFEQLGGHQVIVNGMGAGGAQIHGLGESTANDRLAQIERLGALHTQGILNDEEFAKAKAKLLGES